MSACPRTRRERAETLASELRDCDGCIDADVLDPMAGQRSEWTLEIVTAEGLTPAMLLACCRTDARVVDVTPRGNVSRAIIAL